MGAQTCLKETLMFVSRERKKNEKRRAMTAAVGEYEEEEERRKEKRDGEKNHTLPPHSEFLFNLNAHNTTTHI